VIALHNSGDTETRDILNQYPIDLVYTVLDGLWTIGRASSELFKITSTERRSFTLHLQDDWECQDRNSQWWTDAMQLLDTDPVIGQVRLRLTREQTMINSLDVDGKKVSWSDFKGHRLSRRAAWTLNPFIMRTHELPTSIKDERDGMVQFSKKRQSVAQLVPGVFKHIGDKGESLKARAEKERRYGLHHP
jgi:hypothetical protein